MSASSDVVARVREASRLRVGGLTPLTTIDYPGALAAVVYCQGCPWRCGYCHNPELVPPRAPDGRGLAWADVLAFLARREGLLDAVVFSGGEPTARGGALAAAMADVRAMGFAVGLHTAGPYPRHLQLVLPRVDWVGFDVKTAFARYPEVAGPGASGARARESLALVVASGVDHEVRTTLDPRVVDAAALDTLTGELAAMGVRRHVLQEARLPDGAGRHRPEPHPVLDDPPALERLGRRVGELRIRRG